MPANVETMFSVRETPWHGLGRIVMDAPASREALELAGLDCPLKSGKLFHRTCHTCESVPEIKLYYLIDYKIR